jgi:AcrR family transcriptional regulator
MSAAKQPPRARNAKATRARIEAEALRLFAAKGVDGTTIRDLAQAVGVADAALYRYYASKEEIAGGLFLAHYGALAKAIAEIGARDNGFMAKVTALVELLCGLFDDQPDVFSFILLNQHAHLRYVSDEANAVIALRRIMSEAYQAGHIGLDDADLAAAMALGAVLQPCVFKLYGRLPGPMRDRAAALTVAALRVLDFRPRPA